MSGALQQSSIPDRPTVVEYGALSAVLLVLVGILVATRAGVEPAVSIVQDLFGARFVATAVYSALALVVLGGVVAAYAVSGSRTWWDFDRVELFRLGIVASLLVVLGTYAAVARWQPEIPLTTFVSPGIYYVGMAALAVGYAHVRGLDVSTAMPTGPDRREVGVAVLAVVVATAFAQVIAVGPERTASRLTQGPFAGGVLSPWMLVESVVVPTFLAAVGTALLFQGVVQQSLADHGTPAAAAGAVTATVVSYEVAIVYVLSSFAGIAAAGAVVIAVVAVVAVAFAYWYLWTRFEPVRRPPAIRSTVAVGGVVAAVLVVTLAGTVVSATALIGLPVAAYTVAVGGAAVIYERTDSVVPAIVVLAAYGLTIDLLNYAFYAVFPF